MPRTKQAWEDYSATLDEEATRPLSVHFIPAFGGCFVVLEMEHSHQHVQGWLNALPKNNAPASRLENMIDGFLRWLEGRPVATPIHRA